MKIVKTGLDVLIAENAERLAGAQVAVLANQSAVSSNFVHLVDFLHEKSNCILKRILAPEHGFRGELQDMAAVGHGTDRRTGVPVVSLYGASPASLRPKPEDLEGIEFLVADLPDVGTRYYTFAQTLGYCLEACAPLDITVLVLDRPNPISGTSIEGSPLLSSCRSFCGYAPVPQRHGLTLGELAVLMNNGFAPSGADPIPPIGAKLEIVKAKDWRREKYHDETGIPWVIPSPNMPTLETAVVYPGGCLLEATQISEGRGTTRPFEIFGAPGIEPERWISAVFEEGIPLAGAALRSLSFMPQFQKHAGKICTGLQLHVRDRGAFQSFRWFLALLFSLKRVHPEVFAWRTGTYEFIDHVPAIDLLYGTPALRDALESGDRASVLVPELEKFEQSFVKDRQKYLLY